MGDEYKVKQLNNLAERKILNDEIEYLSSMISHLEESNEEVGVYIKILQKKIDELLKKISINLEKSKELYFQYH